MATRRRAIKFAAVAAATAAIVVVPTGRAQLPSCPPGSTNVLYCQTIGMQQPTATSVRGTVLSANVCRSTKVPIRLIETIVAAAGVRSVKVTLDGRTIKTQKGSHLSLTIHTRGLKTGIHTVKIIVTDRAGRKSTHTMHFRICKASHVPKFTG